MFGSRTIFAAIAALTFGALGAAAETTEEYRARFQNCTQSIQIADASPVFYFEYDDPSYLTFTYRYNNSYCDSTILINSIKLLDNVDSVSYTCTTAQFTTGGSTLYSECQSNTR